MKVSALVFAALSIMSFVLTLSAHPSAPLRNLGLVLLVVSLAALVINAVVILNRRLGLGTALQILAAAHKLGIRRIHLIGRTLIAQVDHASRGNLAQPLYLKSCVREV